jgi:hypothetical protein
LKRVRGSVAGLVFIALAAAGGAQSVPSRQGSLVFDTFQGFGVTSGIETGKGLTRQVTHSSANIGKGPAEAVHFLRRTQTASTSILVVQAVQHEDRLFAVDPRSGAVRALRAPLALATAQVTTEDTGNLSKSNGRNPAWSADGAFVAFSDRDGRLFVMKQDGSGLRELTDATVASGGLHPFSLSWSWSRSGDLLAFAVTTEKANTVWITHGNGSPTRIVEDADNPEWRADGMILVDTVCDPNCGLAAVSPNGGTPTPVADHVDESSVSPDGKLVAVGFSHGLEVMSAWGKGRRSLTHAFPYEIAWAPDSRRIAFNTLPGVSSIRVADLRSGRIKRLRRRIDIGKRAANLVDFVWSPRGDALAVRASLAPQERGVVGPFPTEILIVRSSGRTRRLLTGRSRFAYPDGLGLAEWEQAARIAPWKG